VKFFSIILTIYFLGLNFAPCSDAVPNSDDGHTEISQAADAGHDHATRDMCSPFCQCNCCHVNTIDSFLSAFKPLQPIVAQLSTLHFDSRGKDFQNLLLQPPRA